MGGIVSGISSIFSSFAPIASVLGVGASFLGLNQSRRAARQAQEQANAQRAHQEQQTTLYNQAQAEAATRQAAVQKKTNASIARAGKARLRGGIFGDEPTPGVVRKTLG